MRIKRSKTGILVMVPSELIKAIFSYNPLSKAEATYGS